jgi:hypothetical protein
MMSEVLMLYQSILNLGISHAGKSHKRQDSAITILLNKWVLCKIGLSEYDLDQDVV